MGVCGCQYLDRLPPACYTLLHTEFSMKQGIHPDYRAVTVTCACGNKFEVGTTREELRVEICNNCHPFYTGKQKFVDTARRVEKFKEKMDKVGQAAATRAGKKVKRAKRVAEKASKTAAVAKKSPKKEKKEEKAEA